jgi:outer membrane protein assembly factor BamC
MKVIRFKYISLAVLLATTLGGCSLFSSLDEVVPDNSKKYRKAETMPPLDVPPDLSTVRIIDSIAGSQTSSATYSEFEEAANNPLASKYNVAPETKPALTGQGKKRHLVVPGELEALWERSLDFWREKDIDIVHKDFRIGLMDTAITADDYAYRLRLQRGDRSKTSSLYISAASGENNAQKNEAMLRQLAEFLGALYQQEKAEIQAVKQSQPQIAVVNTQLIDEANDQQALMVEQDFSSVWRRVGRILDSKGFAVEDRDRTRGIYFVHYLDPLNDVEEDESGILSSLAFWKDEVDKSPEEFYYIKLISDADKTKIVVLDAQEIRTSSDTAKRLLTLMQEQLSQ